MQTHDRLLILFANHDGEARVRSGNGLGSRFFAFNFVFMGAREFLSICHHALTRCKMS